jgi:hypothetical protein
MSVSLNNSAINIPAGAPLVCIITDEKEDANGGTNSQDTSHTRTLNTIRGDHADMGISIDSNVITIPSGKYLVEFSVPAVGVNQHQAILYDDDATSVAIVGSDEFALTTGNSCTRSNGWGIIEPSSETDYTIRHYTSISGGADGFGVQGALGNNLNTTVNVYTQVKITKLG